MTVIEAIKQAEEIAGTLAVSGRENVRKMNVIFDLLDASIAALENAREQGEKQDGGAA